MRHVRWFAPICGITWALCLATGVSAAQFKFPNQTITVPYGFEVQLVAGPELVERPISGSFDEQGRLYVTDSSGSNEKPAEQLEKKPHRVVRLEDVDGDGKFDKAQVFANKVMFPEGCLWYDGSLYVAAPPSIWKLTDTNNDGVVDVREEWHKGQTLTGCANDLHGPYLGPDGWLYWCKGAFAKQTYELDGGKHFESRAAHIFRARPDHTGMEPVMTGGMDNPVGLAFTAEGERILCGTFFETHVPGHRDGLIHAIYGGVYGKINDVTDDAKKTGDLMPIMTHMGPAAPCAVIRYESKIFGDEYQNNLFVCSFNLHKVTRHILEPDGATFKTKDSDFLVSDNPDFHPTDVIEDADGSLLILNTGGWYKICCPTSQLSKPDVLGAIYRVRRVGAQKIEDPRGLKIAWKKLNPSQVAGLLGDERVFVQRRAMHELSKRKDAAIPPLREIVNAGPKWVDLRNKKKWITEHERIEAARAADWPKGSTMRQKALWTLTRIDSESAREVVRLGLKDADTAVRCVALQAAALHRDKRAVEQFVPPDDYMCIILEEERLYYELLGRTREGNQLEMHTGLMIDEACLRSTQNRILQHAFTYALIESRAEKAARSYLHDWKDEQPAALIALDQMDNSDLKAKEVQPLLQSEDPITRKAAVWVASHHPEWGSELVGYFEERLDSQQELAPADREELRHQLVQFARAPEIENLVAKSLENAGNHVARREMLLEVMREADLNRVPSEWVNAVRSCLAHGDTDVLRSAAATARALSQVKTNSPNFSEDLLRIARNEKHPADLRLEALAALPNGLRSVEPGMFAFLCANVDSSKPVMMRSAAVSVLTKSKFNEEQLLTLTETIKNAGPLEMTKLLTAFEKSKSEAVGLKLLASLKEAKGLSSLRPDVLKTLLTKYPATVQDQGKELLALLNADGAKQGAHIDELLKELKDGDVRRGQAIFNSQKAACFSCHTVGYLGGKVGPDLTSIGQVRTERDLLESVIYPSASFVRSYEPYMIMTKSDEAYSGVLKKDAADEVVLATGPGAEVRIARADITEMRPSTVSVMPAGLEQQMSKQELADLLAFLKSTKWGPR
jgi:putative membrane-bound dehydrogenase-like protein